MSHRISLMHFKTFRAGENGYNQPRSRGDMHIRHDSKLYVYEIKGREVTGREAQAFMRDAWSSDISNGAKITGHFPDYQID